MSKTTKVQIGLTSARELELEVEDAEKVASELEAALADGTGMVWIADARGHRHGVVVSKVAFIQVEREQSRPGVGFQGPGD